MLWIVLAGGIVLVLWCCLKVSSRISRDEEK